MMALAFILLQVAASVGMFTGREYETSVRYTTREGLASDVVHYIHQDRQGYLWFATDTGVNRFDGHRFTHFSTSDGLGGNEIFRIFEDSRGRLWFLAFNGVPSFFDQGRFHNPSNHVALSGIRFRNSLSAIVEDHLGRIWLGNETGEILRISDTAHEKMFRQGAPPGRLKQLWQLENQRLFAGTTAGVFEITGDGAGFTAVAPNHLISIRGSVTRDNSHVFADQVGLFVMNQQGEHHLIRREQLGIKGQITGVRISPQNSYMIITTHGGGFYVYRYDDAVPELVANLFTDMSVSSVHFDNEMSLWVGSSQNGVYRIDEGYSSFRILDEHSGLQTSMTVRLFHDAENKVWAAGADGSVYNLSDSPEVRWQSRLAMAGDQMDVVEQFLEWKPGRILVGSVLGLHEITRTESRSTGERSANTFEMRRLTDHPQFFVIKDMALIADTLYLATNRGLMRVIDEKWDEAEQLVNKRLTSVSVSANGRVFVGTVDGLFEWDGSELLASGFEILDRVQINQIQSLFGHWLGISTSGMGAILLCSKTREWHRITTEDGLTSDMVNAMDHDQNGSLWIATNNGLNRIRIDTVKALLPQLESLEITVYSAADGVHLGHIHDMVTDRTGHVWMAGTRGVSIMQTGYGGYPPVVIPVRVEEVLINGHNADIRADYVVSHHDNDWEITFTGIFFRDAPRIMYRYRMSGLDQQWTTTQANRVIYRSIPPGSYTFEVEAFTSDGRVSSELVQTQISVQPAVWQRSWFQLLGSLLILAGLVGLIRFRETRMRALDQQQQQTATQITELEYQALQSMMNPHFIFNVLNSIRYSIVSLHPDRASDMLADFAHLIRLQLDSSYKQNITLHEELERIQLYIKLESERIARPVDAQILASDDIRLTDIRLPALILQPFVENAIIHGIAPGSREGRIQIQLSRSSGGQVLVQITDNGSGLKNSAFYASSDALLEQVRRQFSNESQAGINRNLDIISDVMPATPAVRSVWRATRGSALAGGGRAADQSALAGGGRAADQSALAGGGESSHRLSLGIRLVTERLRLLGTANRKNWYIAIVNTHDEAGAVAGVCVHLLLPLH